MSWRRLRDQHPAHPQLGVFQRRRLYQTLCRWGYHLHRLLRRQHRRSTILPRQRGATVSRKSSPYLPLPILFNQANSQIDRHQSFSRRTGFRCLLPLPPAGVLYLREQAKEQSLRATSAGRFRGGIGPGVVEPDRPSAQHVSICALRRANSKKECGSRKRWAGELLFFGGAFVGNFH